MSNYRRLISYIYAYEGGVKGKNIGYAKIEVRGDQCRIQVNVKKVYVGSNDIGVYLLSPGAEIMLGKIFIRGGAGEFRASVHSGNVEGSGYSMDQCYGLTVHDVESTWQCYTTIWDDAVTQAAELGEDHAGDDGDMSSAGNLGAAGDARDSVGAMAAGDASGAGSAGDTGHIRDVRDTGGSASTMDTGIVPRAGGQPMGRGMGDVTEKAAEIELADVTSENVRAKEVPAKIPTEPGNGAGLSTRFPVSAEIERELSKEEARLANVAPWEQEETDIKEDPLDVWLPEPAEETLIGSMEKSAERMVEVSSKMKDYIGELADSVVEESMEGLQETIMEDSALDTSQGEMVAESIAGAVLEPETVGLKMPGYSESPSVNSNASKPEADKAEDMDPNTNSINDGVNSKTADSMDRQKPDGPVSSARMMQEAVQQAIQALMGGIMTGPEKPAARGAAEPETGAKRKLEARTDTDAAFRADAEPTVKADIIPMPKAEEKTEQMKPVSPPPEPGDPARLEVLDRMEKEASSQNHIWNQLGRRYPRVLAFDYDYGCEILSIKPQDIGLLPREVWVYGNNSFLLHGYYNYRHLILAKLNNPKGRPRYLLGVPGHYFSNEKYMASMFGFPNFVLAKKQPEADGRYGYWYTDIRM